MKSTNAEALLSSAVASIDPRLSVRVQSVDDAYQEDNGPIRLASRIVGGFGAVAWLVAIAGVYAVMAYLVSARTREIGVRMALGADGSDVRRLVLGSAMWVVLGGTGAGLLVAAVCSRFLSSQMYGVSATDPATYAGVALGVVTTAVAATWLPMRRAARIAPAVTLRSE
jgi:ABC-type antimicrobial peptide transport system permease subunit